MKYTAQLIADVGCIVCRQLGYSDSPAEVHHLRDGVGMSQRNDDNNAIPLCHVHHRTGGYGVAFHAGKNAFEEKFGTERELLEQTHALINKLISQGEI